MCVEWITVDSKGYVLVLGQVNILCIVKMVKWNEGEVRRVDVAEKGRRSSA